MYTREQLSRYRTEFWTKFGQYMKPVQGAGGSAVNWINYKTGIRHIFFKMDADVHEAIINIQIRHTDAAERMQYFEQFEALQKLLEQTTNSVWHWQPFTQDELGTPFASISRKLRGVSIANEADWPDIISFLKSSMVSLDEFWELVKDGFE